MEDFRKTFFIGDIHGCLDELKALLAKIGWSEQNKDIRVILLGDLVDRGPDSIGVVKFCREKNLELIRGNHDDRYVKYHNKVQWHKENPKNAKPSWLKNYPDRKKILDGLSEEDIKYLVTSPTVIYFPEMKTVAVHAGFLPGKPIQSQDENTRMHVRFLFDRSRPAHLDRKNDYNPQAGSRFWAEDFDEEWNVIYGHHVWDFADIKIHHTPRGYRCIGIDTGCCFGGKLTALELSPDGKHIIHQVDSKQPKGKKVD